MMNINKHNKQTNINKHAYFSVQFNAEGRFRLQRACIRPKQPRKRNQILPEQCFRTVLKVLMCHDRIAGRSRK